MIPYGFVRRPQQPAARDVLTDRARAHRDLVGPRPQPAAPPLQHTAYEPSSGVKWLRLLEEELQDLAARSAKRGATPWDAASAMNWSR